MYCEQCGEKIEGKECPKCKVKRNPSLATVGVIFAVVGACLLWFYFLIDMKYASLQNYSWIPAIIFILYGVALAVVGILAIFKNREISKIVWILVSALVLISAAIIIL
jgi:hypothetical protein